MPVQIMIHTALSGLLLASTGAWAGELVVPGAWARATPPGVDRGAGYMVIENSGDERVRLTGAETGVARKVEIHRSKEQGDRMSMEHLEQGLAIPAGGTVALEPMGTHLMLMGLEQPLKAGDEHDLTLEFSNDQVVNTSLEVRSHNSDNAGPANNH